MARRSQGRAACRCAPSATPCPSPSTPTSSAAVCPPSSITAQEILAADPLHNTFLGWQAYWGNTGYYQQHYGYSLTEAVDAIVDSGLPIQMGLDHITDLPSTEADYGTLMSAAEANGVGWLWWDFYNPYGAENNLTVDGSSVTSPPRAARPQSHDASIANTARSTCEGGLPAQAVISVNAGGAADGGFVPDTGFTGGNLAAAVRGD